MSRNFGAIHGAGLPIPVAPVTRKARWFQSGKATAGAAACTCAAPFPILAVVHFAARSVSAPYATDGTRSPCCRLMKIPCFGTQKRGQSQC